MKKMSFALITFSLIFCGQAFAKGVQFGDKDSLRKIQDVAITSPKGDDLYLANRITTKYFLAGVFLTDQGYVLATKATKDEQEYYTLSSEQVKAFQAEGILPTPMPTYEISTLDYVFGYSLWIIILVLGAISGIKKLVKKTVNNSAKETT